MMLVKVDYVVGAIPKVTPIDVKKSKAVVKETNELVAKIEALIEAHPYHQKIKAGTWIDNYEGWSSHNELVKAKNRILRLKTIHSRRKLVERLSAKKS
jgi:hypothetical protein